MDKTVLAKLVDFSSRLEDEPRSEFLEIIGLVYDSVEEEENKPSLFSKFSKKGLDISTSFKKKMPKVSVEFPNKEGN